MHPKPVKYATYLFQDASALFSSPVTNLCKLLSNSKYNDPMFHIIPFQQWLPPILCLGVPLNQLSNVGSINSTADSPSHTPSTHPPGDTTLHLHAESSRAVRIDIASLLCCISTAHLQSSDPHQKCAN